VDLDGDGRTDILSGSWPGEIYLFRRNKDGSFATAEILKGTDGQPLNVGHAAAAFAADWMGTGRLDLVVGTILGHVLLIPNESKGKELAFGTPRKLEIGGEPLKVDGEAAPVVADWDGDGRLDLIVGAADGSVVWYRNIGTRTEPRLEGPRTLVDCSSRAVGRDGRRGMGDWGIRVKPCVADWRGDGRLALLLGEYGEGFNARPSMTQSEKDEELKANDRLPGLRQKWAETFKLYQESSTEKPGELKDDLARRLKKLDLLRTNLGLLKDEIAMVQDIQGRYQPGYQAHGHVWLFERKATIRKGP
jgi:hypothetical protein